MRQLRSGMRVTFGASGAWQLSDGTLDVNGAEISAPPEQQIFRGNGLVRGLRVAQPEWFASPVRGELPAGALQRAYQATVPWGAIQLGNAAYLSPFFEPADGGCGGRTLMWDSPRTLVGIRRPVPDSETDPTRLENGTVIRGAICGSGVLRATHLGVDAGPYVVATELAGRAPLGIVMANHGALGTNAGSVLEDVSVLTTGLKDQHSVLLDGQRKATVKDLWIWTLGGTHGLVMKSFDSTVQNLHCAGASADCLILKSDYITDHAGQASNDIVDGVFLHFLKRPGDTGGIYLDARWDSLTNLKLLNVHEQGLSYGIQGADSIFHSLRNVLIDHWTAEDMTGPCLQLTGSSNVRLEHFHCSQHPGLPPMPPALRSRPPVFIKGNLRIIYTQAVTNLPWLMSPLVWSVVVALPALFFLKRYRGSRAA